MRTSRLMRFFNVYAPARRPHIFSASAALNSPEISSANSVRERVPTRFTAGIRSNGSNPFSIRHKHPAGTHERQCLFPPGDDISGRTRRIGLCAMPAKLSVNLNAVALLRNRRDLPWPDVIHFGRISLQAGAHGLTVHPRPDERHTRFSDLPAIRALIDDEFPAAEFNIEGYPTGDFLALAEAAEPEQITLVPDDPEQPTSDHGWDFVANQAMLT